MNLCDIRKSSLFFVRKGFTLLEIIIVLLILGVLTRIVIPRMTEAKSDDAELFLQSQLVTLRAQLDIYRTQHLDQFPCGDVQKPADSSEFVKRLTNRTNADHSENGIFGPYLVLFPTNSFNGLSSVRYGSDRGANKAGWCFDRLSGEIYADDPGRGPEGTLHSKM